MSAASILFQLVLEIYPFFRDHFAYGVNNTAIRLLPGGRKTPEVRLARWDALDRLASSLHNESTVENVETTAVVQSIAHVRDVLGGNHTLSNVVIDNAVGQGE